MGISKKHIDDLKKIHGFDFEEELCKILKDEIDKIIHFDLTRSNSTEGQLEEAESTYINNPPLALKKDILTRIIKLRIRKIKENHGE